MDARTRNVLVRFGLGSGGLRPIEWQALSASHGFRDAMGVRATIAPDSLPKYIFDLMEKLGFAPFARFSDHRLLVLNGGVERTLLVHEAKEVRDRQSAYAAVIDQSFDPRRYAVIETPVPRLGPAPDGSESATITDYREEEVEITARVAAPALLVLFDSHYPGWQVEVDGGRQEMLRADYLFRAVALEPGEHRVRFVYRPLSFRVGGTLSLLGLVLLGGLTLLSLRYALRTPSSRRRG
jgi:hypothetical protein